MQLVPFTVTFDDAEPFTVQPTSRDLVKMEKDGIVLSECGPLIGGYTMAWYALCRLKRQGKIDVDPGTLDEFMDSADIDTPDDEDPEGNDSGQVPTPGSSAL